MYHTTPLDQPIPLEEARLEGCVPLDPRFPGRFDIDPDLLAADNMRLADGLLTGQYIPRIYIDAARDLLTIQQPCDRWRSPLQRRDRLGRH